MDFSTSTYLSYLAKITLKCFLSNNKTNFEMFFLTIATLLILYCFGITVMRISCHDNVNTETLIGPKMARMSFMQNNFLISIF